MNMKDVILWTSSVMYKILNGKPNMAVLKKATLLTIQGKLKEAVTVWKDPVEFLIKLCEDVKQKNKKRRRNSQQSLTGKYKKMRIIWK